MKLCTVCQELTTQALVTSEFPLSGGRNDWTTVGGEVAIIVQRIAESAKFVSHTSNIPGEEELPTLGIWDYLVRVGGREEHSADS